jgi:hypothetical protein
MKTIPLHVQLEIACAVDDPKFMNKLLEPYGTFTDISDIFSFSSDDLYSFLRRNSNVCHQIFNKAGDKRWTPATYIDKKFYLYEVGWYENGFHDFRRFFTLAAAVTDYILASWKLPRFRKNYIFQ